MHRVQLSMPSRNINLTKSFVPPKSQDIGKWVKVARKVLPQIPDLEARLDWKIFREVISDKTIMLELRDSVGNKCAVIMERQANMGR